MFFDRFPFCETSTGGVVVSFVAYRFSCASVRQGWRDFSMFLGILFVIPCIVGSLNLFGMAGFLLVGFMGKGGGAALQQQDII